MKSIVIAAALIIFFAFLQECLCQSIMEKLINDEEYLRNVWYTSKIPGYDMTERLKNFPVFKNDEVYISYDYQIYYYKHGEIIIPLAIKELATVTTPEGNIAGITSNFVVGLERFQNMSTYPEGKEIIQQLINIIKEKEVKSGVKETFQYNREYNHTIEILDRNQYYKEFSEVIGDHLYPYSSNAIAAAALPPEKTEYHFQLSVPGWNLSASHNLLQNGNFFGFNSFGFEFGLRKDKVLNLQEYQNPVLSFGYFFFCDFGNTPFAADVRILGQKNFDNKKLLDINAGPVFDFDKVQINKASGVTIDAHILGCLGNLRLPFLNFYWSQGMKEDFKNPVYNSKINSETGQSYYSLNQLEMSISFFWVADNNRYNKFRLDVGGGSYDIWKVLYDKEDKVVFSDEINNYPQFLPMIAFEYIHSSENYKPRFGSSIRYFDNRINFRAWLRLLRIDDLEIRAEQNFISGSFRKEIKNWDHKGSSNIMQLIFRYGLN